MPYYSRNGIHIRAYSAGTRLLLNKPLPKLYPTAFATSTEPKFRNIAIVVHNQRIIQFDQVNAPELQPINHNNMPWANLLPASIREIAHTGLNAILVQSGGEHAVYIFQTDHQGLQLRFHKLLAAVYININIEIVEMYVLTFVARTYYSHYLITHNYGAPQISSMCAKLCNISYRYMHSGDILSVMIFGRVLTKMFITQRKYCTLFQPSIRNYCTNLSSDRITEYDHHRLFDAKWMLIGRCSPEQTEIFYSADTAYLSRSIHTGHTSTFTIVMPSSLSQLDPVLIATKTGDLMQFTRIYQSATGLISTIYKYTSAGMQIRTIDNIKNITTNWQTGQIYSLAKNDKSALKQCTSDIKNEVHLGNLPINTPEEVSIIHEICRARNVHPPKVRVPPLDTARPSKVCAGSNCRHSCIC